MLRSTRRRRTAASSAARGARREAHLGRQVPRRGLLERAHHLRVEDRCLGRRCRRRLHGERGMVIAGAGVVAFGKVGCGAGGFASAFGSPPPQPAASSGTAHSKIANRLTCYLSATCRPAEPGGARQKLERPFRPLEAGAAACSSYAEATYRKRRNASSSTRPMADDPIHNRDGANRRPRGRGASPCAWPVCVQRRLRMGISVLGGALVRRAAGLRWVESSPQPGAAA